MSTYNGHPSWGYWNVALWIGNDEGLYNLARSCIRRGPNRRAAAQAFRDDLCELMNTSDPRTPDGARYSLSAIQHGMRGL